MGPEPLQRESVCEERGPSPYLPRLEAFGVVLGQLDAAAYNGGSCGEVGDVWQMKALMTLVLVLLLAGCAAGQGGAGRTPTEETTAHNAGEEETTVLKGEGNLPRPPDSTLSYGGQEVKGTLGSYCWSYRSTSVCADSIGPTIASKQKTLTVLPDSEMVFRYGGQNPPKTVEAGAYSLNELMNKKGGVVRYDHTLNTQGSGVQRTIPAEMPPGEYVLDVLVEEQQNGADYYFHVMVD
jgi:hypothetical protein